MKHLLLITLYFYCTYASVFAQITRTENTAMTWLVPQDNAVNTHLPLIAHNGKPTPALLLPPLIVNEETAALLFRWEPYSTSPQAEVEYELLVKHQHKTIFAARTHSTEVLSGNNIKLTFNELYNIVLNVHVTENQKSYVIDGASRSMDYRYIPECTTPKELKATNVGRDRFTLSWQGKAAKAGNTEYVLRYCVAGESANWLKQSVTNGQSITLTGLQPDKKYAVELQKVCFWKDGSTVLSKWVPIQVTLETMDARAIICGEPYTYPQSSYACYGVVTDSQAQITLLHIGEIPIEVDSLGYTIVGGPEGPIPVWSGTGVATLPIANARVRVRWKKVTVNYAANKYNICGGKVFGVKDDPANYPDLGSAPAVFGNEICTKPPSTPGFDENGIHSETNAPWDTHGFGPNGTYVKPPFDDIKPGMPFDSLRDPNGFDVNGVHIQTNTKYGPDGCSMDGLTATGDTCQPGNGVPYYWLKPVADPEASTADLLESIKDSLKVWVVKNLGDLNRQYRDSVLLKTSACEGIRATMNGIVTALGYERELVFGPGEVYFARGMWKKFAAEPVSLAQEIARDPNQVELEKKHIDLYRCDKKLDEFSVLKSILDSLATSTGTAEELTEAMRSLLSFLPGVKADSFAHNHVLLVEWLRGQLLSHIRESFCDGQCLNDKTPSESPMDGRMGAREANSAGPLMVHRGKPSAVLGSLAATPELDWSALFAATTAEQAPSFLEQYLSGAAYINGVHRSFYVEALGEARKRPLPDMGTTVANPTLMPVEIPTRASDGRKYSIWIDNVELTPISGFLDAYIVLELPNSGQKIAFSGVRLPFTPNGFVANPARLQLATTVKIRMNNAVELKLKSSADTYVSFDCSGYAGIGLDMDVEVCREIVKPLHPTNYQELPEPNRVSTNIQLFVPTWDEIYAEVNIQPFVITGLEDYKWIVSGIVVDFSDVKSPNYQPPTGYVSPFASNTKFSPLWRGFYMNSLSVRMPNQFDDNGTPLTVGVQKVVLDHMGVSGQVFATPLLPLEKGDAGGWAFSVDTFKLTVLCNQPVSAGFNGLIHIPLFAGSSNNAPIGPADCFRYRAFLERGDGTGKLNYRMTVDPGNQNWTVDMWKSGKVIIKKGSQVTMEVSGGHFSVVATLHGKVKIDRPLSTHVDLNIPNITFQNLVLSNTAPYFRSAGVWGTDSTQAGVDFGGFKINIGQIAMVEDDSMPALAFNAGIKISDDSVGLSASGGFLIRGKLTMEGKRQRWSFDRFSVTQIDLNGSFAGVGQVSGTLKFFEGDPVFGTGWRGGVKMSLKQLGEISAVAQFGRIKQPSSFRYFFIDGLVCLENGIGGAIKLTGFGGGVYHHMNRPADSAALPSGCGENPAMPTELGASLSGLIYIPDRTKGLGLKATVALATAVKKNAFNANATLELLFNDKGGLSDLWINGNARFMSDPDPHGSPAPNASSGSAVSGTLDLYLNFNEGVLDGYITVNIDAGGGSIYGNGTALIHAEEKRWFIKIGTPAAPFIIGLSIPFAKSVGQIHSYMEIGNDIDPPPPVPAEIEGLLKRDKVPFPIREGESLTGFILGAGFTVDRSFEFKPLYGGLKILLGFDVSLIDYGSGTVCGGSTGPLGINGWYARGQMYAGVWANLGIKVKVFGKHKQFNLASIAQGVVLEAGLPNPFWAKGAFVAEFNLLGGLIKGRCPAKFDLGTPCQPVDSSGIEAELDIVESIRPADQARAVAVNASPEVVFNFPIGKAFQLEDPNGNLKYYHAVLDAVKLRHRGIEYGGELQWAEDKRSVKLLPNWILPARDTVEIVVRAHVDSSGVTIQNEEKTVRFVTGPGLDYIPNTNVTGSWPSDGQFNFFPGQMAGRPGYIQLKQGQPDLFYGDRDVKLLVRFSQNCGPVSEVALDYNGFSDRIEFPLPEGSFVPGGIYRMQVIEKGPGDAAISTGGAGTAARMVVLTCPPERAEPTEKVLYAAYFRVSQHATFGAKLSAWSAAKTVQYVTSSRTLVASAAIEPFDEAELKRIDLQANLDANAWYEDIRKNLYSVYPHCNAGGGLQLCPDPSGARYWGATPLKAIKLSQSAAQTPPAVTRAHWLSGSVPTNNATLKLYYEVDYAFNSDYGSARQQTFSYLMPKVSQPGVCTGLSPCDCYKKLVTATPSVLTTAQAAFACYAYNRDKLLELPAGTYPLIVRYRMPGSNEWGAEQVISLTKTGN